VTTPARQTSAIIQQWREAGGIVMSDSKRRKLETILTKLRKLLPHFRTLDSVAVQEIADRIAYCFELTDEEHADLVGVGNREQGD
jgi:hypothetical protein